MISDSFDYSGCAGISDGKTLTSNSREERLTAGGSVENYVSDDDVVLGYKARVARRAHDDSTTRKALSNIVIGIAE